MARARRKSYYKGKSLCLGRSCSGHRAGAAYARAGGKIPSPYSPSFNAGMTIEQGTFRAVSVAPPRRSRR